MINMMFIDITQIALYTFYFAVYAATTGGNYYNNARESTPY